MTRFADALLQQFPLPAIDDWRKQIDKELRGAEPTSRHWRPEPGIDVPPFSAPGSAERAHEPTLRAMLAAREHQGFVARERILGTTPEAIRTAIEEAYADGVTEIELALGVEDATAQRTAAESAIAAITSEGEASPPRLILQPAVDGRWPLTSRTPDALAGSKHAHECALDVFAVGFRQPDLDLDRAKKTLAQALVATERPRWDRLIAADATVWHDAGAWTSDELALCLASAAASLRVAIDAGLGVDEAARQLVLRFPIDQEIWLGSAKLRAARVLWSLVSSRFGIDPTVAAQVPVVAIVGGRMRAARFDTYTNLLRTTLGGVAATIGCADVLAIEPFEPQPTHQTGDTRRLARRQLQLLRDESFLDMVQDPAGGARQLEDLTEQLARKALDELRAIEAGGGLGSSLDAQELNARLRHAKAHREVAMRTGERVLLGINRFADPSLETPDGGAALAASAQPSADDILRRSSTDGFGFERLREALAPLMERPQLPIELWACGDPKRTEPALDRARNGLRTLGLRTVPEPVSATKVADLPAMDAKTRLVFIACDEGSQPGCRSDLTARLGSGVAAVWLDDTITTATDHAWSWPPDADLVLALARITRHLLHSADRPIPDDIQTWCTLDARHPEQFLITITESDS